MIALVNNGDSDPGSLKLLRGGQSAEAGSDDDDVLRAWHQCAIAWLAILEALDGTNFPSGRTRQAALKRENHSANDGHALLTVHRELLPAAASLTQALPCNPFILMP